MRTSSEPLAAQRSCEASPTPAPTRSTSVSCRPTSCTSHRGARRSARCDVHRVAQSVAVQRDQVLPADGAAPVGQDTGLSEIRELAEAGIASGGDEGIGLAGRHARSVRRPPARPGRCRRDEAARRRRRRANGMGGKVVPAVFDRLPIKVIPLYFELDGTFPNHPADPIQPENLRDLQDAVLATRRGRRAGVRRRRRPRVPCRRERRTGVGKPHDGARREADPRAQRRRDGRPQRDLFARRA